MFNHLQYAIGLKKEPISHKAYHAVTDPVVAVSGFVVSLFDTSDRDAAKAHEIRVNEEVKEMAEIELLETRIAIREMSAAISDYRTHYGYRNELTIRREALQRKVFMLEAQLGIKK